MTQCTYAALIPTLDRPEMLNRFLISLAQQTRLPKEVVIVDQSRDDSTKKVFEAWQVPSSVKKTYIHRQIRSLILSRNVAIDSISNVGPNGVDLACFLDDDLVLQPDFCENIVSVFEKNPGAYAGGMGTITGARFKFKPFQQFFMMPREGNGKFSKSGAPTLAHWKKDFTEVEFLSGGITFWKTEILKAYKFDERMAGYGHGDDVDISYRVSRSHKLFYQPTAQAFHDDHSPGRDRMKAYRKGWIQNMYYLAQKNHVSKVAFAWCVIGHLLRDTVCSNFSALSGDLEAIKNIFKGNIDTVVGYSDFLKENNGTAH